MPVPPSQHTHHTFASEVQPLLTQRDNTKVETADSSIGRADACGALPGPAGVDYSRLDKKCSSKPDYTTETTDGDGAENSDVDSASMECPPATGDERCPTINNQVRAVNGICFKYFCGMTGYWEIIGVRKSSSFGDCVKFCAETAGCQVCLRVVATHDCWLSSVYPEDPPVLTPGVNMAFPIESRA